MKELTRLHAKARKRAKLRRIGLEFQFLSANRKFKPFQKHCQVYHYSEVSCFDLDFNNHEVICLYKKSVIFAHHEPYVVASFSIDKHMPGKCKHYLKEVKKVKKVSKAKKKEVKKDGSNK